MRPKKISLPVVGNLKKYLTGLVVLWLLTTVTAYGQSLVVQQEAPPWLEATLTGLRYLSGAALAGLILWGLWSLVVWVASVVVAGILPTKTVEVALEALADIQRETSQVSVSLRSLAHILAALEQDAGQASLLLLDAEQHAATLIALTKGIALKAEAMRMEAMSLQAVLEAVSEGDRLKIAAAAGRVRDAHIRELLLCDVPSGGVYWEYVARLTAAQSGTLEQWTAGYERFVAQLLAEISGQKARLAALTASLELVGVARPLLQIQHNLDEAEHCLQPQGRVELGAAFQALPTLNAGLLK